MEKLKLGSENQGYRDNLAKELKDKRSEGGGFIKKVFGKDGRTKAEKILKEEKQTEDYKEADKEQKELRRDFLEIKRVEESIDGDDKLSRNDLIYIIENISELKEKAGMKLLEQDQDIDTYRFLVRNIPSMRTNLIREMREKYPIPEGERTYEFTGIDDKPDDVFNNYIYEEPDFFEDKDKLLSEMKNFKGIYSNEACDVSIGLYEEGFFEKKDDGNIVPLKEYSGESMQLRNGMYIKRKDGTFNILEAKEEQSLITSVNSVKIVDNKVFAEIQFSDGTIEVREVGREKVLPIYRVYRDNESYKSFFGEGNDMGSTLDVFDSLKKIYQLENDFIIEKGKDIVEDENIKNIPDDAIVITDRAALEALPSIRNKNIVRIDEVFKAHEFDSLKFDYYLRKINSNPKVINILKECVSSHAEKEFYDDMKEKGIKFDGHSESGKMEYVEYLKREVLKVFKDIEIRIIEDARKLEGDNKDCINIIDRHARTGAYNQANTLKLPLYGNEAEMSGEFAKTRLEELKNEIDKIEII